MFSKVLDKPLALGAFLLPALMALLAGAASGIFILFFLISVYTLSRSGSLGGRHLSTLDQATVISLLVFVLIVLLGYMNAADTQQYWSRFERAVRAFGCVVIFLYLVRDEHKLIPLLEKGVLVGSLLVFLAATEQVGTLGRAEGAYNAILFGDFSAYLACAAAAAAYTNRGQPLFVGAFLAAVLLSGYASILSGTRGSWIGLYLGLSFVLLVSVFSQRRRFGVVGTTAFALSALALFTWAFSFHPLISSRMSEATQTFLQFFSGGDPNTSVGYRLQMWGAAYDMWIANPLLGSGLGDYSRDLAEMIRLGQSSMNAHFGEAHSLYFEFLGTTGLLGFMTLMAGMFVLPLLTFLGVGREGGLLRLLDSPASLHGVCLVIAFSSFGISQNWLGRSSISSVYFLCLALFLAAVVYERRKDEIPEKGQGA